MNARSRFSQSSIPNGHTACGPTKKTVVRGKRKKKEKEKKRFSRIARLWQSSIQVHAWRSETVTDQRFSTAASLLKSWTNIYMPVYRSSPCLEWCPTARASLFRIISPVISGNHLLQTNQTFREPKVFLSQRCIFQSNRGIVSRVILTNWRSKLLRVHTGWREVEYEDLQGVESRLGLTECSTEPKQS